MPHLNAYTQQPVKVVERREACRAPGMILGRRGDFRSQNAIPSVVVQTKGHLAGPSRAHQFVGGASRLRALLHELRPARLSSDSLTIWLCVPRYNSDT